MATQQIDTADRIAMLLGGGLIMLGLMVADLKLVAADAATPIIAAGLVVWLGYTVYRLARPRVGQPAARGTERTA